MNMIDLRIIEGQEFNSIMNLATILENQNEEGIVNALNIYNFILNKIDNCFSNKASYRRGIIKHKIWNLEKKNGNNEPFFSQAGQDKLIYENFFKNKNNSGYFVDIGAYDGINGSNSYFFEKDLGWRGLLIEPSRKQFLNLKNNRTSECVNSAISNKIQRIDFVDVVSGYTQMSGLKQEYYNDNYKLIQTDLNSVTEIYEIETSTFSKLVNEENIDYLSIDIEGGELNLLHSIDFNFYKIKVISIENNKPNKICYNNFLYEKGFTFFDFCGNDEIYYSPDACDN